MTTYVESYPRARKTHECQLCWRTIRVGEKYRRAVGLDNGEVWAFKECLHCRHIMDTYDPTWGEYEYFDHVIADWEPTSIPELRLKAMWKRKWIRRDGDLYELTTPWADR